MKAYVRSNFSTTVQENKWHQVAFPPGWSHKHMELNEPEYLNNPLYSLSSSFRYELSNFQFSFSPFPISQISIIVRQKRRSYDKKTINRVVGYQLIWISSVVAVALPAINGNSVLAATLSKWHTLRYLHFLWTTRTEY